MALLFDQTNFINTLTEEKTIKQFVYYYTNSKQTLEVFKAKKLVFHLWGGGGGGGGADSNKNKVNTGAGGGGSFTILDFPYYPTKHNLFIEIEVGKGGNGGKYNLSNYIEAENGGKTTVLVKDKSGRILKEFISFGGKAGQGNGYLDEKIKKGGDGGSNSIQEDYVLMGAVFEKNFQQSFPKGGNDQTGVYNGDHCQMNYLSVSGSGGGANYSLLGNNDGGSFLLQPGGKGYTGATGQNSNIITGGGGGSTYYGRGGDGGYKGTTINNKGKDGEPNSGAGGGGSYCLFSTIGSNRFISGGNGAHGMVVIEVYN
jgi:hypothetical protein